MQFNKQWSSLWIIQSRLNKKGNQKAEHRKPTKFQQNTEMTGKIISFPQNAEITI